VVLGKAKNPAYQFVIYVSSSRGSGTSLAGGMITSVGIHPPTGRFEPWRGEGFCIVH
jgi:hypothetical protein